MKRSYKLMALPYLLSCAGCGEKETPPEPSEPGTVNWPVTEKTDRGGFYVKMQPAGNMPIERNRHFSLEVAIEGSIGNEPSGSAPPAGSFQVYVDADMPAHRHGMNTKPELTEKGAGKFQVDGMLFHMGGDWVITADVRGESGVERATFPVHVE